MPLTSPKFVILASLGYLLAITQVSASIESESLLDALDEEWDTSQISDHDAFDFSSALTEGSPKRIDR